MLRMETLVWLLVLALVALAYRLSFAAARRLALAGYEAQR
jgi:hypothetical protein